MKVLLITGSRTVEKKDIANLYKKQFDMIIHGDCRGTDKLVAEHIRKNPEKEIMERIFPYESRYGKAGGLIRNQKMVNLASRLAKEGHSVVVWAFPKGEARGTRNRMMKAREAGLHIVKWPIDEKGYDRS